MSKFSPSDIVIKSIKAYYDKNTATSTNETANLLQYESQHFRCKVNIELNEATADSAWSIGLIQACDHMYLENRYGEAGSSFWEFHPLKSGRHKMVNDSDGRQYPFYSLTSSKCEIRKGIFKDSAVSLQYEDHFYPTVAWELPYCGGAKLTDVIRKQDFWIWLVAIKRAAFRDGYFDLYDVKNDTLHVMKTLRWRYNLHMTFDPHMPIGKRLKKVMDVQDELPYVVGTNQPVPLSAVNPPHCNAGQSLIWYPRNQLEKSRILVPPRQIIVPWDKWLSDMIPHQVSTIAKPKDCKYVGDYGPDTDIGHSIETIQTYGRGNKQRHAG